MALRLIFFLLISCTNSANSKLIHRFYRVNPTSYSSVTFPDGFCSVRKNVIHSNFHMSAPAKQVRLQIVVKDVKILYDCSDDTARRKINQARTALGKADHQEITVKEFCDYWGFPLEEVLQQLKLLC